MLTRHLSLTQLRFLEGDVHKCLRTALQFEHETVRAADNQVTYNQAIMRKLAEISQRRNQNPGGLPMNGNGGQMALNQNPAAGQMNPRAQQPPNMGMPPQQMANNGMNQLGAPGMQPSMSQNGHQQQPHMNATPGPQQGPQMQAPTQQEIQEQSQRMMAALSDDKKNQLRNNVMRNMSEQVRQQMAATGKDPLIGWIFQKARQEVMARKMSAQANGGQPQQNSQMANAGGVSMAQSASQQGNNFDFTAIMGQQANALKLQESGNEVVPASNNPNNPFSAQMNQQNGPPNGINPAMLGNGNGQNGSQMPPNMTREQMQMLQMQREKMRVEQMRNNANANNQARAQAMQQAQLHGQNMGTQNALNGAAGGSPAMTMLNRPLQPPGNQTPNTPSQPNRAPNMQQPNSQQVQTPGNGPNALMQHHQSMVNRNNSGTNMQALIASLPFHPIFKMQQAQVILRTMPPQILEKLRATPTEQYPEFLRHWANTQQARRNQNPNMQAGGSQGGNQVNPNAMGPNGMPDMKMQRSQQGQPQLPPGMDPAQFQARLQQHHQQQQQQQQQLQHQQQQQQQSNQQPTPMQQMPPNVVGQLPNALRQQAMLSRPFPPPAPQQLGIAVPPQMRLWGQLKSHIDQNQNALPPGTSQRFSAMISKWFQDRPDEFEQGVKWVIMQRQQQQQQQQQAQGQNGGQLGGNNNNMGMPNGGQGGAPTAQMMQPNHQMQQGANGLPMGIGQGQLRMPPQAPIGPQDIAMYRQKIAASANMTDDQVRLSIEGLRRKGMAEQNNALKQAQMQNQLSQNAGGNQQPRPSRTPAQSEVTGPPQQQQQQTGQKRPQPPSTANDDVMEIPNPNAQQSQAKSRPSTSLKLPNLTPEQIAKLGPAEREQLMKRYESLRQANAGARTTQNAAPAPPQAATGSQQSEQKNYSGADLDNTIRRLYQEVGQKKGPPVQQDASDVEQIAGTLRKLFRTYSQIDKVFATALRLPEFTEERIKRLMQAKIMVFHNYDPNTDSLKPGVSMNLQQAMMTQKLVAEFLRDMNSAKARGQLNQQFAQQAQNQGQQQQQQQLQQQKQQPAAAAKQQVGQAPTMEKSASKHGRKASSSSKPPPAPTDNKSFDWGVGAPSPHGIPKYESGSTQLTPDKLKFPPNKRRRTGQPESAEGTPAAHAGTPSGASPGVGGAKPNSPEQLRKAQIQARVEAEERDKKRWKCTKDAACEASITGFETEDELKQHFDSIHKEIENPLQFLLDSAAQTLGVDLDGKPLPGKVADKPKLGARLLPPKAAAMKRESSLTPAIKQEARTPAGQGITPATPGSGSKGVAKQAGKPSVAITDAKQPSHLHNEVGDKMGYRPISIAVKDVTTGPPTRHDRLWDEISDAIKAGLGSCGATGFDDIAGIKSEDWGLRPDEPTISSPEATPQSSSASQNSDVSSNDRLRINLEWDPFGNGDVAVPEALNVAVGDLGLGGSDNIGGEAGKKDTDGKATINSDLAWSAEEQMSWDNLLPGLPSGDGDILFDFSSGGLNDVEMKFSF